MSYETVIGLEVHVQLATRTKLFCGDAVEFGTEPNTRVCPVCLGLPGVLPVTNARAVELAVTVALGLGCTVHETSIFARKNYFYPDLPKGYQITQYDRPLATGGSLDAEVDGDSRHVRIRRIHIEEDAGKSLHDRIPVLTAIDLNRAGVPLIEIVTEPDIPSPAHARAFLTGLKQVLQYLDVSDCDMEKGSLRVDANVSVRPAGESGLGTKTEVKNLNSFANVERALAFEAERQARLLGRGEAVEHETRLWDEARGGTRPMRTKEETEDYRYFPDPDLPALVVERATVHALAAALPELPAARRRRFTEAYALPAYDAGVLTAARPLADYYEAVAESAGDPKAASNWVMTEVLAWLNQHQLGIQSFPVPPGHLGELIRLVSDGTLSSTLARRAFARMAETGRPPAEIVEEEGWVQVSDTSSLERWVEEALAAHPAEAERYRGGEARVFGFLMGEVMKRSRGRADPKRAREILRLRLEG